MAATHINEYKIIFKVLSIHMSKAIETFYYEESLTKWGRASHSFYQKKQKNKKNDTAKEFLATNPLSHAIRSPRSLQPP
ncbi:hypothetical protein [Candidatus Cardinium hertigii]|jgi:hypothetical protein|uniref:Uncharacterized protein n=1 Tax=Candidatus Cardinium hertigii TaxID=247481 RepID=A0A3N2QCW9_9BACT|nr:hypothetical protein [Candidatus Cardinium hertigii]ROT47654.1 hypothetical protein EDM02_01265 [Candidatus Cardinium hertigii]